MYKLKIFFSDNGKPYILYNLNEVDIQQFKSKLYNEDKFIEWVGEEVQSILNKSNITVVKIISEKLDEEESDEDYE